MAPQILARFLSIFLLKKEPVKDTKYYLFAVLVAFTQNQIIFSSQIKTELQDVFYHVFAFLLLFKLVGVR